MRKYRCIPSILESEPVMSLKDFVVTGSAVTPGVDKDDVITALLLTRSNDAGTT